MKTTNEKKEKVAKARIRKEYSKEGTSQKMMSLRIDSELLAWLEMQPNKGRYINNLIKADKERGGGR